MAVPDSWVASGVAVLVALVTVAWYVRRSRCRRLMAKMPGPPGAPLIGNLLDIVNNRETILDKVKEYHERYGPVCKAWVGPYFGVSLTDPRDISVILNGSKSLSKPVFYTPFNIFFGDSLLAAEVEIWKRFRKIMAPTLTLQVINNYISTFCDKSQAMAHQLEKHTNNIPFDVVSYTMSCSLKMVTETTMGVPMDNHGMNQKHCFITNVPKIFKILGHLTLTPWFWFTITFKFTKLYQTLLSLLGPVRDFVALILKQKTSSYSYTSEECLSNEMNDTSTSKQRQGFLDHMIATLANEPELFTLQQLIDQALLIVAAATDTSGYTVAHTLMLLALHQDVQDKVVKEQEDIFGKDINRPVTANDLKRMVFLEQVINESLRLYSTVPFIVRLVDSEIRINGYTLPSGTNVVIPIFLVHRDPTYYPDPHVFDPERFNKENSASRPVCSFIPFASGRRMCLGRSYAYMAMKTMLSVILRRFNIHEYGSREDMESSKYQFFLKLVKGYNLKIGLRQWEISD
ncbi:cytochrome P450 4g1-like [Bacillus rossius redtenbacheri]|uniref:cytochrome P450 4g1-like n=1 Tax=Bacillus rossius redtenbacheri TaxID=93214 RepID=UPI002FDD993B